MAWRPLRTAKKPRRARREADQYPYLPLAARMFEQLCRILLDFAAAMDIPLSMAQDRFASAARARRHTPYSAAEAAQFHYLLQVSEVLSRWYREPRWLDAAGEPACLPLDGEKSFATLMLGITDLPDPDILVEELIGQRILIRLPDGTVRPRRRVAGTTHPHPWMLDRFPAISRGLHTTFAHNCHSAANGLETLCERGTTVRIPASLAPAFNHAVKEHAQRLVDLMDNWPYQFDLDTDEPKARASMQIFVHIEDALPRKNL